ncbi:MAG TPA: type II toxin-antitoxin system RelE/ParE family toxin [Syntrophales bacterium]|nr:type II toxin-antitoxin system RelE/ParE family toxin [Syntrophales bacterium]
MTYNIQWHEDAVEDLKKIDRQKQRKIIKRIKDYLSQDPLGLGKPLKGIFKGLYRYRYGSYRIIYTIDRDSVIILILRVGDRKDVYDYPVSEN